MTHLSSQLRKTCWCNDDELEFVQQTCNDTDSYRFWNNIHVPQQFIDSMAISLIHTSNANEGTLGCSSHDSICAAYHILNTDTSGDVDVDVDEPVKYIWNIDGLGSSTGAAEQQVKQHILAYKYLVGECNHPFSIDVFVETHRILTKGAVDAKQQPIPTGIRKTPCHSSGGYVYCDTSDIVSRLQKAIVRFNSALTNHADPIISVMDLFYETITIHPFADGNGRFCRLLTACAFMSFGTPFPIPLTSGHTKSANHINLAIFRVQHKGLDRSHLYTIGTFSLHKAWMNAKTYMG
jgi:hypothetical protein